MKEIILSLKGVNGQLELYNDKVIIRHKGLHAKLLQGLLVRDKQFYLSQICSVQFKAASNINGYIRIIVGERYGNNKNVVSFSKNSNEVAYEIKEKIKGLQQQVPNMHTVDKLIVVDEIKKYKELLNEDIITKEEYEVKKKQLLNLDEIKKYKELLNEDIITQEEYDIKKKTIIFNY